MKLDSKLYYGWFLDYVKQYGNEPEVLLKKEHSLRVATDIKLVFGQLDFSVDYISLAEFIGLYHDIGRFEQWRKYHTFLDNVSVDHAEFSVENLFCKRMIEQIYSQREYDSLIYDAIKYHNKLALPTKLSMKDESIFYNKIGLTDILQNPEVYSYEYRLLDSLYAMSIRDADKLDILRLYSLSDYLLKNDDLPVSDKVSESFFANQPIRKEDRKTAKDTLLLRLSFLNDINLTKFLILIREKEILEKMNRVYPNSQSVQLYFDHAYERLEELIEKNKNTQYVLKK